MTLSSKDILIFGGTGALGRTLVKRFQEKNNVIVFSRDEAKHYRMQMSDEFAATHYIGDIRDYAAVKRAIDEYKPNYVIHAAALKQVPLCESFPYEAVQTNVVGTQNIVRAIEESECYTKALSVSSDKACKPVNAYGMTKALQEKIHLNGNLAHGEFVCVRYGNVLESTGSVIPVFKKLLLEEKDLCITHEKMTRFLMSLDHAVDLIEFALEHGYHGHTYIPKVRSAYVTDIAKCLREHLGGNRMVQFTFTGKRPGEKLDEILVSEEELEKVGKTAYPLIYYKTRSSIDKPFFNKEYSSGHKDFLMDYDELNQFLQDHGVV